ncbi:hypothetical protein H9Q72_004444 [Fusarium xylarioides]|uniref:Chromo domain-containing protein n=1 Tax=Fusarium xylarioides TaxID=221167 RepID=A0A9P7LG69_9HYPO|nr:hypothetical protein H9Q70_014424 [Fusarium xylarioides]KAG5767810.1 hypothetical protein H9Q72_004444 [Fusarium xylarioides]KAG5803983.1 hypothetical protein H9Q71_011430 [Fusarium xylarioides]KAG5815368.1 hypothetical protein H9Q74_011725 [Fusarium xylarioides]
MASLTSSPNTWTITPSPMDSVQPNFLILKHKVDTVGDKDGPFVALFIRGSKSRARWEGWVDEKFVHERDEGKLLAYWQRVGGRDAQGVRESCPLRVLHAHQRRESEQGTEYLVQYVGYPNDDGINQWEPESKVLEAQWD